MLIRILGCLLLVAATRGKARADDAPTSYAVVVGSNQGGEGQAPLQFAERDAERFAELLIDLGRTPREQVQLLLAPSASQVRSALQALQAPLSNHAARGEPTRLTFFYSGHARSDAANLGAERLPLGELREALTALPTSLTVVILDACQSGAFSGVKGAGPAADFSVNSVERLNTEGLAVLASSTAAELSQESEALGAGYFAHHLMVAMRGPADANEDGRVSLDESYRYAYQHTLADTARTRIGSQHVTLETSLKGKGDVPLTYPAQASAQLWVDAELSGTLLITQGSTGAVMAEVEKPASAPLHLALPAGDYEAVMRSEEQVYECALTLVEGRTTPLQLSACEQLTLEEWRAKGAPPPEPWETPPRPPEPPKPRETWFLEVGVGANPRRDDAYSDRLEVFGFEEDEMAESALFARIGVGRMFSRNLGLSLSYQALERVNFRRAFDGPSGPSNRDDFGWTAHRVALGLRVQYPALDRWLVLYADASIGLALAATYFEKEDEGVTNDLQVGPGLEIALGVQSNFSRFFGLFIEGGYGWAPVPENLAGDRHNAAGGRFIFGARLRLEGVK